MIKRSHRSRVVALGVTLLLGLTAPATVSADAAPQTGDSGSYGFLPDDGPIRVNVVTGNLLLTEPDLPDATSTYHVAYTRSYNSLANTDGILGRRWNLSVGPDVQLAISSTNVALRDPTGARVDFAVDADGTLTPTSDFAGTLEHRVNGTYLLTQDDNSTITFDQAGAEIATSDASARPFTVQSTSAAGKTVLSSYGTSDGRRINVSYNGDGRIRLIDDPASGHRDYGYTNGLLTTYGGPGGSATYAYNAAGYLTTATYSDGRIYTVVPLSDGRTQSLTIHVPGATDQTWTFAYDAMQTTVTNPDGSTTPYPFDTDGVLLEDPEITEAAAEAYIADYPGVPLATAKAWMTNQDRSGPVGEQIGKTSIQSGYAGLWYDNANRRVKLNLLPGTPTGPAHAVLQQDGVDGITDIVTVNYTQSQIDGSINTLAAGLDDVIASGHLRLSRDTEHNSVRASLASTITATEEARVRAAAVDTTAPVIVEQTARASFLATQHACKKNPRLPDEGDAWACDAPLRGGVRIDGSVAGGGIAICSAGFTARSNADRKPFLLTAGHCLTAATGTWFLRPTTGSNGPTIGGVHKAFNNSRGDFGAINISDALAPPLTAIAFLSRKNKLSGSTTHYRTPKSGFSRTKQYVCMMGASSGLHCGKISADSVPTAGEQGQSLGRQNYVDVCTDGGDSGGPVIRSRTAVGLISTGPEVGSPNDCETGFAGAKSAESNLNVSIGVNKLRPAS